KVSSYAVSSAVFSTHSPLCGLHVHRGSIVERCEEIEEEVIVAWAWRQFLFTFTIEFVEVYAMKPS
ncbi:MAG TPA: hypothetical protein VEL11_16645, partial [Candidatus Bathyarchaeia archaeon]|nr:hypothetical protein [Candidatus Bathyarchaeia archaeon]